MKNKPDYENDEIKIYLNEEEEMIKNRDNYVYIPETGKYLRVKNATD